MTYRVEITPRAQREINKLDRRVAERMERAMHRLSADPRTAGCKKLSGHDIWRIRVGD